VLPFVEGRCPSRFRREHRVAAAHSLARIHHAAATIVDPPPRAGWPAWHHRHWSQNRAWSWPALRRVLPAAAVVPDRVDPAALAASIERHLEVLPVALRELAHRPWATHPLHGDYTKGNLHVRDDRVVAVFDWDESRVDWRAWDIADAAWAFSRRVATTASTPTPRGRCSCCSCARAASGRRSTISAAGSAARRSRRGTSSRGACARWTRSTAARRCDARTRAVSDLVRCTWAGGDPAMVRYHDQEWGVPEHDDRALFEFLTLEGAQAGLSWRSILIRRNDYRAAFAAWDIERISRYGERDVERLLADPGIIRNRAKVHATIGNARAALDVIAEWGSLDRYLWQFVDEVVKRNAFARLEELPAETPESKAMSRELKRRGFGFVGPTICYAFMQATGMVNDHVVGCFRYGEV